MYYNNKSSFYINQYGSKVAITTLSILLVISLSFIYYMIDINPNFAIDIASNKNVEENEQENSLFPQGEESEEKIEEDIIIPTVSQSEALKDDVDKTTEYFDNLSAETFSETCTVTSITDYNKITIETSTSKIEARLIGVSITYTDKDDYISKLKEDLLNKEVKIVFDVEKKTDGIYNVYLYVSDSLYNADILESGLATLESERTNIALTQTLGEAQAYARENDNGVWK